MGPVCDFDDTLKELLVDPEQAALYLQVAMDEGDPHTLVLAAQDVRHAQGDSCPAKVNK